MSRRQFGVSPLADILLDCGVLSREELDAALAEQKRAGLRLDETLVRGGYATDNRIAAALSSRLGLPLLSFDEIHPTEEALALCDGFVSLPMFGTKVSINVGNCAAVVLYMIVAKGTEKC